MLVFLLLGNNTYSMTIKILKINVKKIKEGKF
jgi:hypothetical protein